MTENLLQYIWQFQYFNKNSLTTIEGEDLQILNVGTLNTNQGPDFLKAKIKIGNTILVGSIELHVNAKLWISHNHSKDENYNNIILHVVWQNDVKLNLPFSTLVLQDKVSKILLNKYSALMNANSFIACENSIKNINQFTWVLWKERLLIERLEKKSTIIFNYLSKNKNHWEETFWWILSKNFGIKINADSFEEIAKSISINILAKHKNQIHQLEALLFGQAGLLNTDFKDDYPKMLQKEYLFLKSKYKLITPKIAIYYLRLRPANFPTIRLAQLAVLIHKSSHLFSKIIETKLIKDIKQLLSINANDYWKYHYVFDELSVYKNKNLGNQMINNILINTVVPILFTYGMYNNDEELKQKALKWLDEIAPEKNVITNNFMALQIDNKSAFDSQALIQLKNEYCKNKRCLNCSIGNTILKDNLLEIA